MIHISTEEVVRTGPRALANSVEIDLRAIESTLKVSKPAIQFTFNLSVKKTSEIPAKHVATSPLKIERN